MKDRHPYKVFPSVRDFRHRKPTWCGVRRGKSKCKIERNTSRVQVSCAKRYQNLKKFRKRFPSDFFKHFFFFPFYHRRAALLLWTVNRDLGGIDEIARIELIPILCIIIRLMQVYYYCYYYYTKHQVFASLSGRL